MYFFLFFFWNLSSIWQLIKKDIINIYNGFCILSNKNKKMIAKIHKTKKSNVSYVF